MNKFNPFENFMAYMKRNFTNFDMSNYMQFSTNLGEMTPIRRDFVMPSDFWHGSTSANIRVAPLIAPAFTKINAFIQSYYVSFPSIWKYWNQFISNRPSDAFLNSANLSKFEGVYCEPLIPMQLIAILCKIYYGYYTLSREEITYNDELPGFAYVVKTNGMSKTPYFSYNYSLVDGYRDWARSFNDENFTQDHYFAKDIRLFQNYAYDGLTEEDFAHNLGYYNYFGFIYAQISSVIKNLKNFGLPTELIAQSPIMLYNKETINALPFIAQSKIWQEYIRNPQVQGTELDYYEINGSICRCYYARFEDSTDPIDYDNCNQYGWELRLSDIPYNYQSRTYVNTKSNNATNYIDYHGAMAVLTGIGLRNFIIDWQSSVNGLAILPNYYNGLLTLKYRNFENDFFTSAAPDPMMGRQSVPVPGTIEELRSASKLEEFLEANTAARNFYDFLKHHFGTIAKSVTYGRPEFLGSTRVPVNISEQLQSSQTTQGENGSPLGARAGVADGFGSGTTISKNFEEHGIIITYMSFVIDNQYFQGFPLELQHHKDYLDLPWPEFSNLGLESIPSKYLYYGYNVQDLYYNSSENVAVVKSNSDVFDVDVTPNETLGGSPSNFLEKPFGYSPRYSIYKFKMDQLSGEFADQLEFWNTFRQFISMPKLSHNFLSYENAVFMSNLDRIFATTKEIADRFYVNVYNDYSVSRCLPLVANPQLD